MTWPFYILIAVVGYLLGNFSTGLILGKMIGNIDIRQHGSGNAGTTNMLRTLGWLPSVLTLLGDALKAVLASLIGLWLMGDVGAQLGGVCAVIGHNWPVFFGFKGGKGMAASFGTILVVDPLVALILLVLQVSIFGITKYMSIASIATAIIYPVLTLIFYSGQWGRLVYAVVLAALALYCHRGNIQRLISGNENWVDFSKIKAISSRKK